MTDIIVHHVELSVFRAEKFYLMAVEREKFDGFVGLRGHLAPADVFESRAAEYDIDPTSEGGWDDLFHLVIVGDQTRDPLNVTLDDPDHLFNAPTVAHAREAALGKIRRQLGKRKLRGAPGVSKHRLTMQQATALTNSGDEDPLEFIKLTAPMSEPHIRVKQEYTRRHRNLIRARRANRHPMRLSDLDAIAQQVRRDMKLDTRESAEELERRLFGRGYVESRLPPRDGPPSKDIEPDLHDLG